VYYGKQNSSNSDYYNSSYQYRDRADYLTLILKILLILLLLGILFVGFLFISNKTKIVNNRVQIVDRESLFKVSEEESSAKKEELSKKIVKEITLAKSHEAHLTQVNLTQEDIAHIVSIVMQKMNSCKTDITTFSDNDYTKELLSQDVDKLNSSKTIVPNVVNTKKIVKDSVKLSDTDHYNKIVINRPKEETYTNDRLSRLSIELNSAIDEDNTTSNYTQAISKEITVRSNEMRIIVVKKGDSLSKIAKRAYGSYDSYIKIFEANPEIIKNPNFCRAETSYSNIRRELLLFLFWFYSFIFYIFIIFMFLYLFESLSFC